MRQFGMHPKVTIQNSIHFKNLNLPPEKNSCHITSPNLCFGNHERNYSPSLLHEPNGWLELMG